MTVLVRAACGVLLLLCRLLGSETRLCFQPNHLFTSECCTYSTAQFGAIRNLRPRFVYYGGRSAQRFSHRGAVDAEGGRGKDSLTFLKWLSVFLLVWTQGSQANQSYPGEIQPEPATLQSLSVRWP